MVYIHMGYGYGIIENMGQLHYVKLLHTVMTGDWVAS